MHHHCTYLYVGPTCLFQSMVTLSFEWSAYTGFTVCTWVCPLFWVVSVYRFHCMHEYVHYFEWSAYTGFTVCTRVRPLFWVVSVYRFHCMYMSLSTIFARVCMLVVTCVCRCWVKYAVCIYGVGDKPGQIATHSPLRVKNCPSGQKQPSAQPSTPSGASQLGGTSCPQAL
jgi:hypothetical protein